MAAITISKIKRLMAGIGVSLIACFELCFTGRADYSWRIARADSGLRKNRRSQCGAGKSPTFPPEPAPFYSTRLIVVIAIAVLIIAGILVSVERPDGQLLNKLGDGIQGIDVNQEASGMGKEPPSSRPPGEKAAVVGCVIASVMIIGGIYLYKPRRVA